MDKALRKHVFHEVEVGGVAFRTTLRQGRVLLRAEDPSGRQSEVDLMGSARPSLFYAEAWTVKGRDLGPGWALCHDSPDEPVMHLGDLSDASVLQLVREFGLHVDLAADDMTFPESAAARSLKRIVAEDPERAVLFRKNAKWLDAWLNETLRSEAPRLASASM